MKILVTGGAGYIGSQTAYALMKEGHEVIILDSLEKGHQVTLDTLRKVAGDFTFIKADLRNFNEVQTALGNVEIDAVIHFAAFIEVGRSVKEPDVFFENNTVGSFNLFRVMLEKNISNIVFSSTAAVYEPKSELLKESDNLLPESPYGESKLLTEKILSSFAKFKNWNVTILRYFNPAGGISGLVGERHIPETHLIPRLLSSALNENFTFSVYGNDYKTPDGSCIRDYIHIEDLVSAHISALQNTNTSEKLRIFNVGTGKGSSVFEIIKTAEKIVGKELKYNLIERRPGDADVLVANPEKINSELGWKAKFGIEDIIKSAWEYEKIRPEEDYR